MSKNNDILGELDKMRARMHDIMSVDNEVVICRVEFNQSYRETLLKDIGKTGSNMLFLLFYRDKLASKPPEYVTESFFNDVSNNCIGGDYLTPVYFIDDDSLPASKARIYKSLRKSAEFPFVDLITKSNDHMDFGFMPMDMPKRSTDFNHNFLSPFKSTPSTIPYPEIVT